jgi:hypothetical protein
MSEGSAKHKVPPLRSLRFASVGMTGLLYHFLALELLTNTLLRRPNCSDLAGAFSFQMPILEQPEGHARIEDAEALCNS